MFLMVNVVLDVIHFFLNLDVDFLDLGRCHVIQIVQVLKRRNMHEFLVETEIEIDLEPYLENNTCNKLIIHCDKDYMPIVLERAKQYKNEACVSFLTADNLFEDM